MTITCPECLTKFRLEEDRIPEGGAKARCSRCLHVFPVQKPAPPEEAFFSQGEEAGEFAELEKDGKMYRVPIFRWKWAILALIIIVIAAGLIFSPGRDRAGGKGAWPLSGVGHYLSDKAAALKKASLSLPFLNKYFGMGELTEGIIFLEKVRGYYLESNSLNKIFVIEGEAVNQGKDSRSFIKVKGALLNSKGNKVQEREAYCGNILSEKDLKEMSQGAIEKSLSSQFGISFSNVNILPNKNVPFMIVFLDLPPEGAQRQPSRGTLEKGGEIAPVLSDFTVEVTSSQKGSK